MAREQQTALNIGGHRVSGQDVRQQNVLAAMSVANIVKSSLGPVGLDKMLVDDIGNVTISNDGATILKLLEVEHPAAKVLVELAQQQDKEVGDGTTTVVVLAAELLKRANELVKNRIHPTTIITGYRLAVKEACKFIADSLVVKVDTLGSECLMNVSRTSMSSKIINTHDTFFSKMVVDAMSAVKKTNPRGETKYPVKSVNILKAHGKSVNESQLIKGYALNCTVASQAIPKYIDNAKIACLDINLMKARMHLGVHVIIDDPDKLEDIRKRESDITIERVKKILASGANVVFTTKGIDDMCLKYFVEANAMAVRRVKKEDLVRIAKATGATLVSTLSNLEGDETFEPTFLGHAESVYQTRISDDECIIVKCGKAASLILRGANEYMLEEMERSVHDALCVVKRTLESGSVVAGGGSVETALSIYLENFATTLSSREQLAIAEFAQALLVIPKQLSINAAKDANELVSKLRSYHHQSQSPGAAENKKALKSYGLNLIDGTLRNNIAAGVLEPVMSKIKSLKAATEAAISILRIDDMIKLDPEKPVADPHDELH